TTGYISFSESEGSDGPTSSHAAVPATTAKTIVTTTAVASRPSEGDVSRCSDNHSLYNGASTGQERQQEQEQTRPFSDGIGGDSSGDDKWNFGDGDSDDDREDGDDGGRVSTSTAVDRTPHDLIADHSKVQPAQDQQSQLGKHATTANADAGRGLPATSIGNGNNAISVEEPQQSRVVVDRLGRRENPIRRWVSRRCELGKKINWDTDRRDPAWGRERTERQACPEHLLTNIPAEGPSAAESGGINGDNGTEDSRRCSGESPSERSHSQTEATAAAKPKAEANPLASKLGLSAGVPHSTIRGRGPKARAPGRGGRPRYFPLVQQQASSVRNFLSQGSTALGGTRGGRGNGSMSPGSRSSNNGALRVEATASAAPAVATATTTAVPNTRCLTAGPSSPVAPSRIHRNHTSGGAAGTGEGIGATPSPAADVANARGVGFAGARPVTSAGPPAINASAPAGGSAVRPASSGGPPPPAMGSGRSVVGGGAGTAATGVRLSKEQEAVKDTANITRKKAQLPQQEQLEHPTPVGGSWLKNRYIVNNYILLQPLGTGSYAEVRLAKEKTSNTLYAVKIMNKDFLKKRQARKMERRTTFDVGKEETFMDSIKREIAIMKKVHHPNVLRLYEVMDDPKVNKLYLVLEYCKKGDLMNILNGDTRTVTCDPMNDTDVWYIMRQIVQGLSFLHLQNIIHGDIKPQNLLVGSDNVAKIADFGISKFVQGSNQRLQEQAGTPTFMSPELCCGEGYSGQLADVWALGATMYMIRCGKPPFMANQVMALYEKIQNDPLEFPPEVNMSAGLRKLLQAMMEKDPGKRITLDEVVDNRWLQQGDCSFGYARTASTAGDTPTPAGQTSYPTTAPTSTTSRRPNTSAPPHRGAAAAAATATVTTASSVGSVGFAAPKAHYALPGSSGGVGHGLQPPPSLSFVPLTQQGYHAIKVSDDEVHKSITTTGSCSRSSSAAGGVAAAAPARSTIPVAIPEDGAEATVAVIPQAVGATEGGFPLRGKSPLRAEGGGLGDRKGSNSGRGQLSETEESWKSRSFKKKMEGNGSDPKFRGGTLPGGNGRQQSSRAEGIGARHMPLMRTWIGSLTCSLFRRLTYFLFSEKDPWSQPPASVSSFLLPFLCSVQTPDRAPHLSLLPPTPIDNFFDDNLCCPAVGRPPQSTTETAAATRAAPAPSSAAGRGGGGAHASLPSRGAGRGPGRCDRGGTHPGGDVCGVGGGGTDGRGGGGVSARRQQEDGRRALAKRRSSEKFDAVMDTLAAQPPSRLGRGGGNSDTGSPRHAGNNPAGGGNSGGRSSSNCRPIRDLCLRGMRVTSTPPNSLLPSSSSPAAAVSSAPGHFNCINRRLGLVAAASQRQGKRASQEDRVTVAANLAEALVGKVDKTNLYQQYGVFGVFDGHNGQMCSDALHTGLYVDVAKQPMFHQVPEKAIIDAFNSFDKGLCARQEQEGDTSGSTALIVLFDGRSRGLLVANVGDSRCVASRAGGVAARLSSDHRLSRPTERERVAARGGFVTNNRINGVLAISRSFGDVQHKDGMLPALIATPELRSERSSSFGNEAQMEFVVLATDGLWDVVEDQEAVNFVRLHLAETRGDLSGAANGLTKLALDHGSVDNISAVLVWFEESAEEAALQPHPQPQSQQQH
ncbi:unnamed protein product, partial [Scytosiphon promiscuus]